jgi:hypothetical protein
MMGPKKLSTIREEIRQAISATGEDPIRWLQQRIAEAERKGTGEGEVLLSLQRVLEAAPKPSRRKRRPGAKK